MDVMVQWDDAPGRAPIARVSSVASPDTFEAPQRDVVTLYGQPTPETLALALAAAVEARKAVFAGTPVGGVTQELDVMQGADAVGDSAWRDKRTGEVIKRELQIPLTVLRETAGDLLREGGQAIRRLLAGLLMPEWPEGTRRSLTFQVVSAQPPRRTSDVLAAMREADADNFRDED